MWFIHLDITNGYMVHDLFTPQVGTMEAEGYYVNVMWSRRGVGDNDYIFAF